MICYMLRHKFKDEFYSKHDRGTAAVMKSGTGKLFKTEWLARQALKNTLLQNLQVVKVEMNIIAIKE